MTRVGAHAASPTPTEEALDAAVAHYRAEGWAYLPGVVDTDTLAALRARAEDLATGRVTWPGLFFQPDAGTGRYEDVQFGHGWAGPDADYRKIEKLELDPVFRAWIAHAAVERIVRRVIPGAVNLYRAVLFGKAARTGSDLPWHQDAGQFWGLDHDPELQLWTALDDASPAAGCLEVFPRSHLAGLATPLGGVVPRANVEAAGADRRGVLVPARAGDVVLLHNHLWHRSGANTTAAPRRAMTVCYLPDTTRCVRKKRAPRSFYRVFEAG